ncbi:alpha/beta fold hydrolase [Sporosarcina oncorhynchi]|uniref:Alpha/beta fold hydrolase n=1 Tax=Sporosarcina oncorhynchi TaxID=3056444 RepID=A0ABZ0L1I1_9BACL|nr:alpha/beta fold hydrolase [Sporosarcina sp. T2O-4]WOV86045.1 alpha/beta fold hydrolase [Sporosarcina sp. T2O-4]
MDEKKLEMSDNFYIHTVSAAPNGKPKGHIHLLHGMAEHIDRYEEFIEFLVKEGFSVSGHDHRGHGKTAQLNGKLGTFGDSIGFDRIVEDAQEVIHFYKEIFKAPRFILIGHSMGSFIARRYAQLFGDELDDLVCLGTAGNPGASGVAGAAIATLKGRMTSFEEPDHLINKLVFGSFNKSILNPQTPFDWLATDKETVKNYIEDPYCGFVPTTSFFIALFEGLKNIHDSSNMNYVPKNLPVLFLSGSDDPVGNKSKGVWQVANQFVSNGIKDVTVMIYEGGRHEMLQETNRRDVFETIMNWISKR